MKINERFSWAMAVLDVKPTDYLLEIGCGAGILAEVIAGALSTGSISMSPLIKGTCQIQRSLTEGSNPFFPF